MKIACCIWALSGIETEILRQIRDIGFDWIDIQPSHLRTLESQLLTQELGLRVSCLGASFGMPPGASLDSDDSDARHDALLHVKNAIDWAADRRADTAYVVPGSANSASALQRYADSLAQLADWAAARGIKLAVEHFPGTALPTAGETLEFVQAIGHANLYLLYDSGHIQMSGEDPWQVITNADDRLAYVHFDDNDGLGDLHLGLLDGVMTEASLAATFRALKAIDYRGAVSLELSANLPNVSRALRESRDLLMRSVLV